MSLFVSEIENSWAKISLDYLSHEKNRKEVSELLHKMFSFDKKEADEWFDKGYKRLKELKEYKIIECIDNHYYMIGGVRE